MKRFWGRRTRSFPTNSTTPRSSTACACARPSALRYKNNDMADLRAKLEEAAGARIKLIATDGVFSMDGIIANLPAICDLAEEYGALVMVDDSHAGGGFMGAHGARHAGIRPCGGPRGHTHRHVRQGAGRRLRRLHGGEQNHREPA